MGSPFVGFAVKVAEAVGSTAAIDTIPDAVAPAVEHVTEQVQAREMHLRLPARLVPMPGSRLDLLELEDWIIAGFCVLYQKQNGNPPPLSHAATMSGRSEKRVMASWRRQVARGWLNMAKVPHQWAPGQFGHKWRIWIVAGSPLCELLTRSKGDAGRWIAVNQSIARYRSVLATAVYLLAHEQRMVDGAVTLSSSEAAAILSCDRKTVRRLMRVVGATVIEATSRGTLYDLPVVYAGKVSGQIHHRGHGLAVYRDVDRTRERIERLSGVLDAHGVDPGAAIDQAVADIRAASGETGDVRAELLVRVLEVQHRAILSRDSRYRHLVAMRLGSRLVTLLRRPSKLVRQAVRVPVEPASCGEALRSAITSALTETCSTCSGDRLVIETRWQAGRATEYGVPCPDCAT